MKSIKREKLSILTNFCDKNGEIPDFGTTLLGKEFTNSLSEEEGLFLNYGQRNSAFPYSQQNQYGRELKQKEFLSVTLENEYLKAVFLPELGGRLYSLFDKAEKRELLYKNSAIRFCNLALRNAWFAGGIEWNCGIPGHSPFTCSPVYAAVDEDENIFRIYEYERIRGITYQVDFSLPSGSRFLHCRSRIVNPTNNVTPVYWWSNVAVRTGGNNLRVVAPTNRAYTHHNYNVITVPVPEYDGIDITYPENSPEAVDYFWKTRPDAPLYMSAVDGEGKGLVQLSSSRLKGRKLFSWGNGKGSDHWQEWLTHDGDDGKYCEIQAGLAPTQYESLPMPPNTAWEWVELYGTINLVPEKIHGKYTDAQSAVEEFLKTALPKDYAENFLRQTAALAKRPLTDLICKGSSWGALENLRRKTIGNRPISQHLQFTETDDGVDDWKNLLLNGSFGEHNPLVAPKSYMTQTEWINSAEKAIRGKDKNNWYAHYQLGCAYLADGQIKKATERLLTADKLVVSPYVKCVLAQAYLSQGKKNEAASKAIESAERAPDNVEVCQFAAKILFQTEYYQKLYDFTHCLPEKMQKNPRIRLYSAFAAVEIGRAEEGEKLLNLNGGLCIPDMQESEITLGELWFKIRERKAETTGEKYTRKYSDIPYKFSFQMTNER